MANDIVRTQALDGSVLVVAVQRVDGWCAYISAVPGKDHSVEQVSVARKGTKLHEDIARAIFKEFEDMRYAY